MVAAFWNKAGIPIQPEHHAISKLEKLNEKWIKLKKNAKEKTETQQKNETEFVDDLDKLFHIAHLGALNIIKNQEDKDFLLGQREKGCCGCMGPVNMAITSKEIRACKRLKLNTDRKKKEDQYLEATNETLVFETSSSDEEAGASCSESENLSSKKLFCLHQNMVHNSPCCNCT